MHILSWKEYRILMRTWQEPGRGQAIAPTMDELRQSIHSYHSRGDGLSSPSLGRRFCPLVKRNHRFCPFVKRNHRNYSPSKKSLGKCGDEANFDKQAHNGL